MEYYNRVLCNVLFSVLLLTAPCISEAQSNVVDESFVPYLYPTTAVVVRIDSGSLEMADTVSNATAKGGTASELINGLVADADWLKEQLEGKAMFILVDIPFSEAQPPIRVLLPKVSESRQINLIENLANLNLSKPVWNDEYAVVTLSDSKYDRADKLSLKLVAQPTGRDAFLLALNEVKQYPIQVAIVPPKYLWRTYDELFEELPTELGGGPMTHVTQGWESGAMGVDFKSIDAMLAIHSASPEAAQAFAELLPNLAMNMLKLSSGDKGTSLQVVVAALRPLMKTTLEGENIYVRLDRTQELALTVSMVVSAADFLLSPMMGRDMNGKFKQIGLAIHNYESAMGSLPPARQMRGEDGKSGLSWRVHILPYLGELELYNQFKLDEPWDSEHNKPLLNRMPDLYRTGSFRLSPPRSEIPAGYTTVVAPVGERTFFGGVEVMTFGKVSDGLSNTVMVAQVKPEFAVPWTAPDDYPFDAEKPEAGLLDNDGAGYRFLLGDGSVRILPVGTPTQTILRLFQINDGQPVRF